MGYRDVKDDIFRRIRAQEWAPGERLPGEVQLAAAFGCARATVNRAMQALSEDGIIERRRKGGSHVKLMPVRQIKFKIPVVRAEIEAKGARYGYKLISTALAGAPRWLQSKFSLAGPAAVRHVKCLHFADDTPYQYEDRWINLAAVPHAATADFASLGPNEWLLREVPYSNAEVRFSAFPADAVAARRLAIGTGEPLFLAERSTWHNGLPVTFVRLLFAPGYQMVARY